MLNGCVEGFHLFLGDESCKGTLCDQFYSCDEIHSLFNEMRGNDWQIFGKFTVYIFF